MLQAPLIGSGISRGCGQRGRPLDPLVALEQNAGLKLLPLPSIHHDERRSLIAITTFKCRALMMPIVNPPFRAQPQNVLHHPAQGAPLRPIGSSRRILFRFRPLVRASLEQLALATLASPHRLALAA